MSIGKVSGVGATYNTSAPKKVKKAESVQSKKDVAAISSQGQTISKAMQAVNSVPDIRQSEIDRIKPQVDSGTYDVHGNDIVEKLASKIDKRA